MKKREVNFGKINQLKFNKSRVASLVKTQMINGGGSVPVKDCQSIGPACTFGGCSRDNEEVGMGS
ncbi:hypothetical protein ACJD0Z_18640 [Flavobacteriaceae bacterium M23B6Z8]